MPSINMIAPRRAERQRLERDMRRLVYVILAELIIAVGLGGWVFTGLLTTNAQINNLDAELTKLQPTVKQIQRYEKMTKELQPKLELLNQAKAQTMRWFDSLDRLTQVLPETSYLTRIGADAANSKTGKAKVSLRGITASQTKVGEMMLRLHTIPEFESVDLHFTHNISVGEASAVEFEIGAGMKDETPKKGAGANGQS